MLAVLLASWMIVSAVPTQRWVRVSAPGHDPLFVDRASVRRSGDNASIATQVRVMTPPIARRERFRCGKRLMLVDIWNVSNPHDPTPRQAGSRWVPVRETTNGQKMIAIACGKHRSR